MPGYNTPTLRADIAGTEFTFQADLHVYAWLSEMLITEPERFTELPDGSGGRMVCSHANVVGYLSAFGAAHHPGTDWAAVAASVPPAEMLALWRALDGLLGDAGLAGEDSLDPKAPTVTIHTG